MRLSFLSVVPLTLALGSVSAFATTLTSGSSVNAAAGTATMNGTVASFSGMMSTPTFATTYLETVFHDSANPFNSAACGALGCLTFELSFTNNGPDVLEHFSLGNGVVNGFAPFLTNVGYVAGSNRSPYTVDESATGTIEFNYGPGAQPGGSSLLVGQSTNLLFIQTNASTVAPGFIGAIDSTGAFAPGNLPALPAAATTPEPGSLVLLGTGMLGVAGAVRRRLKK